MNVLDYLTVEHRVILEWLSCLEGQLEENSPRKGVALKIQLDCFLKVLEKHALIEDNFLFPELARILHEEQLKPLHAFEFEHQELEKITEILKLCQDDRSICIQAGKLILFLRDHIAKEENVLFPMMLEKVGKNRLEAMLKESCLLDQVRCV